MKVLPLPGPGLEAVRLPPWSCASAAGEREADAEPAVALRRPGRPLLEHAEHALEVLEASPAPSSVTWTTASTSSAATRARSARPAARTGRRS